MSMPPRLTLGALYREMRAGLGDAGRVRVTVEFQQSTLAVAGEEGEADPGSLVLETLVEYDDRVLDRAEVALHGAGSSKRFMVGRDAGGYAYSIDGGATWGRFAASPRIFVLEEFEAELGEIAVEDATYDVLNGGWAGGEPVSSDRGSETTLPSTPVRFVDALDVSLDREAFLRLLAVFSADVEADDDPETPSLNAFSVSLEAAEGVSLQYWWSLSDSVPAVSSLPLRVRCSVSIRVAGVSDVEPAAVRLDESLPEVSHLDDVWGLLRRSSPGGAGTGASQPEAGGA